MLGFLRGLAVATVAVVAGCYSSASKVCADGTVCPSTLTCAPEGGACVEQAAINACMSLGENATCDYGDVHGTCQGMVCTFSGCGNGTLEPGEVCDDGNNDSGDGCRGDCKKMEVCGDAVVDANEPCDDGNANPDDGCDACKLPMWTARAVIGGGTHGTDIGLGAPSGVAVDRGGNIYVAVSLDNRVIRIDAKTLVVTGVAGTGVYGPLGDDGPARYAQLAEPSGIAIDGFGNVYIADTQNQRVRMVDANTGVITTIAGSGSMGYSGDGMPATAAQLSVPNAVAVDGLGNVYIADTGNNEVRRIDFASGIITTLSATQGKLNQPAGVTAVGKMLYVADGGNHRIAAVDTTTSMLTLITSTIPLFQPYALASDGNGHLIVADFTQRIELLDLTSGMFTVIAGTGATGSSGDGGPAKDALLSSPSGVAVDPSGPSGPVVYIGDAVNNRVRAIAPVAGAIDPTGMISTFAGDGTVGYSGDLGAATSAVIDPRAVAIGPLGHVYFVEGSRPRVRDVDATGVISRVAGIGTNGFAGDGGDAAAALLANPLGIAVDASGNIYVADTNNARIRKIATGTHTITTFAGTSTVGFAGDGGAATAASLNNPQGLALDGAGGLYIADFGNNRVRKIDLATNVITTVAGSNNVPGFGGDSGPATSARLSLPTAVAVTGGVLYIADGGNQRVRRVDAGGTITTYAGNGTAAFAGDNGPATSAQLNPTGVAADASGVYIADKSNNRVRRVDGGGTITTFVGTGSSGFAGDGAAATSAQVFGPAAVALDAGGNLYVVETTNKLVRRIDATSRHIETVAGQIDPLGPGSIARATLLDPTAFVIDPAFTLVAGGTSGLVQAITSSNVVAAAGRYPQPTAAALLARFRDQTFGTIGGVAYDSTTSTLFVTETSANRLQAIQVTSPMTVDTWVITALETATTAGFMDGPLATAQFRQPTGLFLDTSAHALYVADTGNHVIRRVDLTNGIGNATVKAIAGVPENRGFFGDTGPANIALLDLPRAITRCANGDLYIADTGNERVRRVAIADDTISSVLGDGVGASAGEGAPSSLFSVDTPLGLACDELGNVYVSSRNTVRIVSPPGKSTIADGTGPVVTIYGKPPRATFPASVTQCLTGIVVIDTATVRVADACAGLLVELTRS